MKRTLMVVVLLAMVAVLGCQQAPQVEAPIDYDAISALLAEQQQAYADAWTNKDMDAIDTMWSHDDDVTIWGPEDYTRIEGYDGPGGVRAWYAANMDAMETIDFKIHDVFIKVARDGKSAVVTYYVENDFVAKDGTSGKGTPRVTVVKEIQDGEWRQIHGDASFGLTKAAEILGVSE